MGRNHNVKTKMICSVRSEILNSINRFVISKELNKITSGYETPLKWDYKNTNSFQHPILKILIKRIKYAEGEKYTSDKALIDKWFPEKINGIDAANYILNNSWCKPRDIVRLILSAQNCMAAENESFSQSTIDMCKKKYSQDSMDEIKEEMRALYSAEQIDLIIGCLTGFKRKFSYQEIRNRVEKYYEDTFLKERLFTILNDLYRLGIIGNFMNGSYRWQHKGDDRIILDDVWMIIIHPALLTALSVNSKQDRAIGRKNPKQGEKVRVLINRVYNRYAFGTFESGSKKHRAFLHISKIANEYVCDLNDYIEKGKKYEATLLRYDEEHDSWHIIVKN